MNIYNHKKIEKKWQGIWAKTKLYRVDLDKAKKPFYNLMMFPYPSAEGLHVGNMYAFTHSDTYGRYIRLKGYDVFEPIGLDGFGIHSENYAIKIKEHIKDVSERTEKHFYDQLHMIGNAYDWSRTVETYKPEYYKWTQWLFLKMYEKGLAYRKKSYVNWCPSCKTVLSDEQVIGGRCERCDSVVEKREMEQWFWRITDYAERLLNNIERLDWTEEVKTIQRNWIGRSEGTEIDFGMKIVNPDTSGRGPDSIVGKKIRVFTTRVDTIFGCTYVVLAPEHELVEQLKLSIKNWPEVEKYLIQAQNKSELERTELQKEKTGVKIDGLTAINPFNKKEIPIFVADYVLAHYGTGAVMAVPAHDERDYEFAEKYNLPIKEIVIPKVIDKHDPPKDGAETIFRHAVQIILIDPKNNKVLCLKWKKFPWTTFITGGIEGDEDAIAAAKRETIEETGYTDIEYVKTLGGPVESHFYANHKGVNRKALFTALVFKLKSDKKEEISEEEANIHELSWVTWDELHKDKNVKCAEYDIWIDRFFNDEHAFTNDGVLINSEKFDGLTSNEARQKMTEWLKNNNCGGEKIQYKLRDWCVSRQRYWGPPIPMVNCEKCGWVPVPEKELPVILPEMDDFLPDGSGKGPLNKIESFVNTVCPKCGQKAKRETDVSDPFVDSCWYYLRYPCTDFADKALDKNRLTKWMPIDMYIGGKEHSVLHLLYSRFVSMVMHELGFIPEEEPFKKFRAHGLLITGGAKISKSKGNIINPDEYIEKFGADAVRLYLMFLGEMRLGGDWRDTGMNGMSRFVQRIWGVSNKKIDETGADLATTKLLAKTIKKVTEDLENLKYNTSISQLMIFSNHLQKLEKINREVLCNFLILLAPFAPFIAEEIWEKLDNTDSIHIQTWPQYDKKLVEDEILTIAIQINGRIRDQILATRGSKENDILKLAKKSEKIKKYLQNTEIIKVIYVPDKLLSLVIR